MFRRIHAPTTLNSALLQRVLPVWNARATRSEWIYQALDMLNGLDGLDRMAVWIAPDFSVEGHDSPLVFQGKVLEADGGEGPEEWTRISGNAPLPVELSIGV